MKNGSSLAQFIIFDFPPQVADRIHCGQTGSFS
jgi:hypothetical protein